MVLLLAAVLAMSAVLPGIGNVAAADPSADDWQRLRQCESGNNYAINTGNGYYGAYQFDLATWRSVGGTGYPHQASAAVQDALALKLWQQRGWSPWACASILGLTGSPSGAPTVSPPPIGVVDAATAAGPNVTVRGWALDPSAPSASIAVHIYVNGQGWARTADKQRPDVNAALGVYGQHGFSESVPIRVGSNSVCVFAISSGNGGNTLLECRQVTGVPAPLGVADVVDTAGWNVTAAGWALDPNSSGSSIPVHMYVNGSFAGGVIANQSRPDVNSALGVAGSHGFTVTGQGKLGRGNNTVCVYALGVTQTDNNSQINCRVVQGPVPPIGVVDVVTVAGSQATVTGWTVDPNSPGTSIPVHIYANSAGAAFVANRSRPDVNAALNISGQHGFQNTVTLQPGANNICAYGIGVAGENNAQIGCRLVQFSPQSIQQQAMPAAPSSEATETGPTTSFSAAVTAGSSASSSATASAPAVTPTPSAPTSAAPSAAVPTSAVAVPTSGSTAVATTPAPTVSTTPPATTRSNSAPPSTVLTTPTAAPAATGGIDPLVINGSTAALSGWVVSPLVGGDGVRVRITLNGVTHDVLATAVRTDITPSGQPAAPLGFTDVLTLAKGSNEVCIYEIDPNDGLSTAPLACRTEQVQ